MEFEPSEQFDFQGTQTNLGGISKELGSRNRNNKFPTILLTDGNQTSGMIIFIVLMRPIKFFQSYWEILPK
jgi:hypothetical protein